LFRLRMAGSLSWKRLLGALACLALAALGPFVPALALAALTVCVLIAVIGAEQVAATRRRARGEPSPLERLVADASSEAWAQVRRSGTFRLFCANGEWRISSLPGQAGPVPCWFR
jgi:hypothetical protein